MVHPRRKCIAAVLALQVACTAGLYPDCTTEQRMELNISSTAPPHCHVINIWGVGAYLSSSFDQIGVGWGHRKWAQGLQIYRRHANRMGGIRLGQNHVGYLNVSLARNLSESDVKGRGTQGKWRDYYQELCANPALHVLLGPVDSVDEADILEQRKLHPDMWSTCAGKPVLIAGTIDPDKAYYKNLENVWSVHSEADWGELAAQAVDFLSDLGAKRFAVAGLDDAPKRRSVLTALKAAIKNHSSSVEFPAGDCEKWPGGCDGLTPPAKVASYKDAPNLQLLRPEYLAAMGSCVVGKSLVPKGQEDVDLPFNTTCAKSPPDVFIGIGGVDTFDDYTYLFSQYPEVTPKAAFFITGLEATYVLANNSIFKPHCNKNEADGPIDRLCRNYDQWMGLVPWAETLGHKTLMERQSCTRIPV